MRVDILDMSRGRNLVATILLVTPENKKTPEHRRAFISKYSALLQQQASLIIVDIVTTGEPNLHSELMNHLRLTDPSLGDNPPSLYMAACRTTKLNEEWQLESWVNPLELAQPLPTMPLWLADNLAVPLELEESYQQSCEILNIS